jgi:hypothetical protein
MFDTNFKKMQSVVKIAKCKQSDFHTKYQFTIITPNVKEQKKHLYGP